MIGDPDSPETIAHDRYMQWLGDEAYAMLIRELGREPTDSELADRCAWLMEAETDDYPEDR